MKKMVVIILLLSLFSMQNSSIGSANSYSKGTWLWNTYEIVSRPQEVVTFLSSKQVTDVYLQIDRSIKRNVYAGFIEKASAAGIRVHALDGAPNWGEKPAQLTALTNWLTTYQTSVTPAQRFSGIRLDVEPYILSNWKTNYAKTVLNYQKMLQQAKTSSVKLGLPLSVDMPFWFDEQKYKNTYGSGLLSVWVIQTVDEVGIMAYRDQTAGPNGILALTASEVQAAAAAGKKITISVETMNLGTSEGYLTFFEEGEAVMNTRVNEIIQSYSSSPAFKGINVHHYDSWKTMKP